MDLLEIAGIMFLQCKSWGGWGWQVYHVATGKKLPEWLSAKAKKRTLRKDAELE
jgi:hypothetical protein